MDHVEDPEQMATIRAGIIRAGAVLCVAATIVAGLLRFPVAMQELDDIADANNSLSYADRLVAGGNGIFPEQAALFQIDGRIPPTATYRVIVGDPVAGWTPLTRASAEPYLRYWLMPRRPADDASWVVCVGCDPAALQGRWVEAWSGEAGIRLLERRS